MFLYSILIKQQWTRPGLIPDQVKKLDIKNVGSNFVLVSGGVNSKQSVHTTCSYTHISLQLTVSGWTWGVWVSGQGVTIAVLGVHGRESITHVVITHTLLVLLELCVWIGEVWWWLLLRLRQPALGQ